MFKIDNQLGLKCNTENLFNLQIKQKKKITEVLGCFKSLAVFMCQL